MQDNAVFDDLLSALQEGRHDDADRLMPQLQALDCYRQCVPPAGNAPTDELVRCAGIIRLYSHSLVQRGRTHEALAMAEDSLRIAKSIEGVSGKELTAKIYSTLGIISRNLSRYNRALEYYSQALPLNEELGLLVDIARLHSNCGNVYADLSDYDQALEQYFKALAIHEECNDTMGVASVCGNIGLIYKNLSDKTRALEYLHQSLGLYESLGNSSGIALTTGNIGNLYEHFGEHTAALEYLLRALAMHEQFEEYHEAARTTGNIGLVYYSISDYSAALEYLLKALALHTAGGSSASAAIALGHIGELYAEHDFDGYDPERAEEYLLRAYALSNDIGAKHHLSAVCLSLAEFYERTLQWEKFAVYYKQYHELKEEVLSEKTRQQAEEIAWERKEAEREKSLAIERARAQATDEILANILPRSITERLIGGEKKIADTHHDVSVLFVDIVGFTKLSSLLPAEELIDLLDIVFTRFDTICNRHGLEKIKTIGDAYMAACGAPVRYENHAERAANAALEMMEDFTIDHEFSVPVNLRFRIGLHSGSVVAGIIGENKYSYDLWGDAVNTASRMESHGEAGKIHVSEEFRQAFVGSSSDLSPSSLRFVDRGEMEIKGKGMMKTYFLE